MKVSFFGLFWAMGQSINGDLRKSKDVIELRPRERNDLWVENDHLDLKKASIIDISEYHDICLLEELPPFGHFLSPSLGHLCPQMGLSFATVDILVQGNFCLQGSSWASWSVSGSVSLLCRHQKCSVTHAPNRKLLTPLQGPQGEGPSPAECSPA